MSGCCAQCSNASSRTEAFGFSRASVNQLCRASRDAWSASACALSCGVAAGATAVWTRALSVGGVARGSFVMDAPSLGACGAVGPSGDVYVGTRRADSWAARPARAEVLAGGGPTASADSAVWPAAGWSGGGLPQPMRAVRPTAIPRRSPCAKGTPLRRLSDHRAYAPDSVKRTMCATPLRSMIRRDVSPARHDGQFPPVRGDRPRTPRLVRSNLAIH